MCNNVILNQLHLQSIKYRAECGVVLIMLMTLQSMSVLTVISTSTMASLALVLRLNLNMVYPFISVPAVICQFIWSTGGRAR